MAMKMDRRQAKGVEGDKRDDWEEDGDKIVRVHVQTRESLFTCPVEDESLRGQVTQEVGRVRAAKGVTQGGEEFILQDDWQAARRPNRRHPFQWPGTTTFHKGERCGETSPSSRTYECLRLFVLGRRLVCPKSTCASQDYPGSMSRPSAFKTGHSAETSGSSNINKEQMSIEYQT